MSRGRPKEQEAIVWQKYTQEILEVPSKPELGSRSVWHYDRSKFDRGPYKTEHWEAKGERQPKFKPEKGKAYGKQPVVMVFNTSNRSNAKTKIKVWNNENIDYIISTPKLVGVPSNAVILELGVGKRTIERYKQKYNLT
tara:strand:+ start:462 stop:878 length:417 start_codon:yes stop_codon:yes gene_type:complete